MSKLQKEVDRLEGRMLLMLLLVLAVQLAVSFLCFSFQHGLINVDLCFQLVHLTEMHSSLIVTQWVFGGRKISYKHTNRNFSTLEKKFPPTHPFKSTFDVLYFSMRLQETKVIFSFFMVYWSAHFDFYKVNVTVEEGKCSAS